MRVLKPPSAEIEKPKTPEVKPTTPEPLMIEPEPVFEMPSVFFDPAVKLRLESVLGRLLENEEGIIGIKQFVQGEVEGVNNSISGKLEDKTMRIEAIAQVSFCAAKFFRLNETDACENLWNNKNFKSSTVL